MSSETTIWATVKRQKELGFPVKDPVLNKIAADHENEIQKSAKAFLKSFDKMSRLTYYELGKKSQLILEEIIRETIEGKEKISIEYITFTLSKAHKGRFTMRDTCKRILNLIEYGFVEIKAGFFILKGGAAGLSPS